MDPQRKPKLKARPEHGGKAKLSMVSQSAPRIPIALPDLRGKEAQYVQEAIQSTWISSSGHFLDRFEKEFASACSVPHVLSVTNGTDALYLALLTLGVGPGDEVIVPSFTYIATANAVKYVGAEPVFVDVDPATWCLSVEKISQAITKKTKGIIAVHLYGHPADMDAINKIAAINKLWVVEDCAEAPLALYKGRVVGSLGTLGTFSFYGNKILTCGEGGAISLPSSDLLIKARMMRGQGMALDQRYFFPIIGHNFRLTNVACAILCAQLERRDEIIKRRCQIFALYRELLSKTSGISFQPIAPWAEPSPWLFCITINSREFGRTAKEVMEALDESGIETRPFFIPLHTLPPYRDGNLKRGQKLPNTEEICGKGLNLPTFSSMSDEDIERVSLCLSKLKR